MKRYTFYHFKPLTAHISHLLGYWVEGKILCLMLI